MNQKILIIQIIYDNNIYEYLFNRYHVHYWLKLKFDILLWYIDLHSIVSIYYIYSISVLLYCLKDIPRCITKRLYFFSTSNNIYFMFWLNHQLINFPYLFNKKVYSGFYFLFFKITWKSKTKWVEIKMQFRL